jgi:WD40 repeat protein
MMITDSFSFYDGVHIQSLLETLQLTQLLCSSAGHETEIVCLAFNSQSTTIATGSMDNTAKVGAATCPSRCQCVTSVPLAQ